MAVMPSPARAQQGMPLDGPTVRELFAIMQERERANGQRFDGQEKAVSAALAAAKEAVIKAEAASEKRFDSVNEFRNTLKDQQQTLLPRAEASVQFKIMQERLDAIDGRLTLIQGRNEGANWLWGIVLGLAGLILGVAAAFGVVRSKPKEKI
jgi:hypothetical protein